jgi:SAM-dependent methyltransferase
MGLAVGIALLGAACLYWLLVITEGTYLGAKIVTLLYDWTAARYDRIKDLRWVHEVRFLGVPLMEELGADPAPRVLDVATGTGRLPKALLSQPDFTGAIWAIDRSRPMLRQGQKALEGCDGRVLWIQADADHLPCADESFAGVTCLEALEFMVRPQAVLAELLRVLEPGGVLLLSNRVGPESWFFPGRICGRGRLERTLRRLGLYEVRTERWQVHYDLVWARKPPSR